ncbi:MAG: domain S-box protein [Solirubrobacterales bacterium]|nr:domain S-box protein [Solirubrobacterales bacterium]
MPLPAAPPSTDVQRVLDTIDAAFAALRDAARAQQAPPWLRTHLPLSDAYLEVHASPTAIGALLSAAPASATSADPTRVLLVEGHCAVREALAVALAQERDLDVVGQVAGIAEARPLLGGVDVLIADMSLPDGDGGDLIRELRDRNPRADAIVLSASTTRADVARAIERGAAGVLSKTAHLDDVVSSVRRVRAGQPLVPLQEVVELMRESGRRREREYEDRAAAARVTRREREVLQGLADGLDSRGVADRLHITRRTERNHMASILSKLGLHSQVQAVVFALRYGLVHLRDGPR